MRGGCCKMKAGTRGSAVERSLHMREADGSNPSGSTVNILFFSRLFYPHIGGVEKHALEISKILIKKGHKVTVVTEKHEKNLKNFQIINKIEVYRIPVSSQGRFKKFEIWSWLSKHKDLIMSADIVHAHDVFFWYLPFRFLFPFKKVFTTFHGYENYPLEFKWIIIHKISEILSMRNICIGNFISKWYGTKSTYTIYGGVGEIKNEKLKIKNENSAIFIGRLDEQTGIKIYVNAAKLIRKKVPNFKFKIIGDGKFRKNIEKDFRVVGFKKNPEKYLGQCHFAFVSRYLSILEAMASKRLVFAVYDNPLKKDYLLTSSFSKFINVAASEKELADLVFYFLENPKKEKEMIDAAFNWVKNKSWGDACDIYLNLWNK